MDRPPILVAEDEETDVFFLRLAIQKSGIDHPLVAVGDGKEAIEYLNGDPPYADRERHPFPVLFLLDLKMPRMTGFDVLTWLQQKPHLKTLPVVILTSSAHEADQKKARELGAVEYRVKPSNVQDLNRIIQELHTRWVKSSMTS
jgi:CheY-like chemotaxis protein